MDMLYLCANPWVKGGFLYTPGTSSGYATNITKYSHIAQKVLQKVFVLVHNVLRYMFVRKVVPFSSILSHNDIYVSITELDNCTV